MKLLLLHAYTGSPADFTAYASLFSELASTIEAPTLSGHDSATLADFLRATSPAWSKSAREAYQKLLEASPSNEAPVIVGLSLGALLAAQLASEVPVSKLILISPPLFLQERDFKHLQAPVLDWAKQRFGTLDSNTVACQKALQVQLQSLQNLRLQVERGLPKLSCPLLILTGGRDELFNPSYAQSLAQQVRHPHHQVLHFEEARHVIGYGKEKEAVLEQIREFLLHDEGKASLL